MKILRTLGLLLGALCGATGLFGQPAYPALPGLPGYRPVSKMQMLDTMQGRKNFIDWTCYAAHNGTKPTSRLTVWLEGKIRGQVGPAPGLDLWDIGAQHRIAKIKLRVKSASGAPIAVTQTKDANGNPVTITAATDVNGFCTIEPNGGNAGKNEYRIQTNQENITIEAYYAAHPPPGFLALMGMLQVDDGGPPSIPPVNEN